MRRRRPNISHAPPDSAAAAGLRYATDTSPGIRRVRRGSGFRYLGPSNRPIQDAATLHRIRSLAIPPAWRDVWISAHPSAHLQATGRDARGRKQYRYHPKWSEVRNQTKYDRLSPFARALPAVRERVTRDLQHTDLCKDKVIAAVVQLLEKTWLRVGNTEYAKANKSFGLTTLRDRHVRIRGKAMRFEFVGKSGIKQAATLDDARLARVIRTCQDLPGQRLFQYIDERGRRRPISSADVNAYLSDAGHSTEWAFTAKDFRTWAGTVLAAAALAGDSAGASTRHTKSRILRAVETVAEHLGNTPAVCRACYIHPAVIEAYLDGSLRGQLARPRRLRGLSKIERGVLAVLENRRSLRQALLASLEQARSNRRSTRTRRSVRSATAS
jgi:DNA topoisomerase-1